MKQDEKTGINYIEVVELNDGTLMLKDTYEKPFMQNGQMVQRSMPVVRTYKMVVL